MSPDARGITGFYCIYKSNKIYTIYRDLVQSRLRTADYALLTSFFGNILQHNLGILATPSFPCKSLSVQRPLTILSQDAI
jgi:hypothetical protein